MCTCFILAYLSSNKTVPSIMKDGTAPVEQSAPLTAGSGDAKETTADTKPVDTN